MLFTQAEKDKIVSDAQQKVIDEMLKIQNKEELGISCEEDLCLLYMIDNLLESITISNDCNCLTDDEKNSLYEQVFKYVKI